MTANRVYLETYTSQEDYYVSKTVKLLPESLISYYIYKCCSVEDISIIFVTNDTHHDGKLLFPVKDDNLLITKPSEIPWQVKSCLYPAVLFDDTVVTGVCAVARHISKFKTRPFCPQEHEEGLLGFRKSCLQAPNEVSIWTKFCEVDILLTVKDLLETEIVTEIPKNLVRFENHLNKPVKVHNVYKIARDIKKDILKSVHQTENEEKSFLTAEQNKDRVAKNRKWKSKVKKELIIDSSTDIKDLDLNHQFAEGPFLTLADLVLLPSYQILTQTLGENIFQTYLPLTWNWFQNIKAIKKLQIIDEMLPARNIPTKINKNISIPSINDVSLYKCDPKRHNPKKRMFTKEDDIEEALSTILDTMVLNVSDNNLPDELQISWKDIPNGANPTAGHLPEKRMDRKQLQLENLALAALHMAKPGDVVVDFCSGSGHLGILVACLLPNCKVLLLENKEQSLLRARQRVHEMKLTNVFFFQCNLDFFVGNFDVGLALHACGVATDLVLDKCLKAKAKFVLCPCCYGSLHATDRLVYPRSNLFNDNVPLDKYLCIGHAADQTHDNHPLTIRGAKCMEVIDSDRARLAEQNGYKVTLCKLKPLNCTPKNNLLIGVPR